MGDFERRCERFRKRSNERSRSESGLTDWERRLNASKNNKIQGI